MSGSRPPGPAEPGPGSAGPGRPATAELGLASFDPREVAALVRAAWGGVIGLGRTLDLDAPSRLPGWTVRNVLVHLGSWPEHTRFAGLVEDARRSLAAQVDATAPGNPAEPEDTDARNALVVAAHPAASAEEIVEALARARDQALAFLTGPEARVLGGVIVPSPVGALPLTGVVAASGYELAIHALDVAPPDRVPADLLDAGVAALVDTTGALAARSDLTASFAVRTPSTAWACTARPGGWTTLRLDEEILAGRPRWPMLEGEAADVLDASAGRRPALALLLARRLRVHDPAGLLLLLPALDSVLDLPGGAALRSAAATLGRTGRLLGRLGAAVRG